MPKMLPSEPVMPDETQSGTAASRQPFHERFWWLPVATLAAGCLALTGVLAWLAYFGGAR